MSADTTNQLAFAERLLQLRQSHLFALPLRAETQRFADTVIELLFPHFSEKVFYSAAEISAELTVIEHELRRVLKPLEQHLPSSLSLISEAFMDALPAVHDQLWLDAEAVYEGDPAAKSIDEVLLAYPGFFAIVIYRLAHIFHTLGVPIFPRILTEYAHQLTGIDIHPGATVGRSFCIDHGTGVVIGETTIIHDHVKIYQGVTLGALSVEKSLANRKRHPTIENNVIIYAHATILGGGTIIGHDSVIGGNVWLTSSVAPHSVLYHHSEVRVRSSTPESESE